MNITSVSFTFENGVKREEYGPTRKASATITAGVDDGESGEIILADIARAARFRVQDALGLPQPPVLTVPGQPDAGPATQIEAAGADSIDAELPVEEEPAKRKPRRTRAQMEADEAAKSPDIQSEGLPLGETSQTTSSGSQGSDDPWSVDEGATEVTDDELTQACAATAQRLGTSERVKEVIASYKPTSKWPEGKPFSVRDILVSQRSAFLNNLKDLV